MRSCSKNPLDYYNRYADQYDNAIEFCDGKADLIFEMAKSYLPVGESRLLDIGCGTGSASASFAKYGCKIFGVDGAPEMLRIFSRKGFAESWRQVNVEKSDLPFGDRYFDLAISNGVFCFIPKLDRVIGEAGRVLKRGGIFCFSVENIHQTRPFKIVRSHLDIYRHSLASLTAALGSAGFDPPLYRNFNNHQMLMGGDQVIFTALLCRKK